MSDATQRIAQEVSVKRERHATAIVQSNFLIDGIAGLDTNRLLFTERQIIELAENGTPLDRPLQDIIDDFDTVTTNVDNYLCQVGNSIVVLQESIVGIITQAICHGRAATGTPGEYVYPCVTDYLLGTSWVNDPAQAPWNEATCVGVASTTMAGWSIYQADALKTYVENVSDREYEDINPIEFVVNNICSSPGIGSFNVLRQNLGAEIGFNVSIAATSGTNGSGDYDCNTFISQISGIESQISELRTRANQLITKINDIKEQRRFYQLQRWGLKYSAAQEEANIARATSALEALSSEEISPFV